MILFIFEEKKEKVICWWKSLEWILKGKFEENVNNRNFMGKFQGTKKTQQKNKNKEIRRKEN